MIHVTPFAVDKTTSHAIITPYHTVLTEQHLILSISISDKNFIHYINKNRL